MCLAEEVTRLTQVANRTSPDCTCLSAFVNVPESRHQAKTHCVEMSESLTSLREDHRKANRALDQLAERGIVLQPPSDDASSGEKYAVTLVVYFCWLEPHTSSSLRPEPFCKPPQG